MEIDVKTLADNQKQHRSVNKIVTDTNLPFYRPHFALISIKRS